jgi:adenine-specific DNA glycosylase
MDLGPTLCRRSQPRCQDCPVAADCLGRQRDLLDRLPGSRPKEHRPTQQTRMLIGAQLSPAGNYVAVSKSVTGELGQRIFDNISKPA